MSDPAIGSRPRWLRISLRGLLLERAGLHVFERVQTVFLGDPNNPDLRNDDAMNLLDLKQASVFR